MDMFACTVDEPRSIQVHIPEHIPINTFRRDRIAYLTHSEAKSLYSAIRDALDIAND